MPAYADPAATEVIPRQTYFGLEKRLQNLRLRLMRLSAEIAHQENQGRPVNRADALNAMRRFTEHGLDWDPPAEESVGDFPDETYMFVEKRLHNLRVLLTQLAGRNAKEGGHEGDRPHVILPEHVDAAWKMVASNRPLLRSVLLAND